MGAPGFRQALAGLMLAALIAPANGEFTSSPAPTIGDLLIGCEALLENRLAGSLAQTCHLAFMDGGYFDGWAGDRRAACRRESTELSLAFRYVSAARRFLGQRSDSDRMVLLQYPWTTLNKQAFDALCG